METKFIDALPSNLLMNARSMCGTRGEAWLRALPELISDLEGRWSIRVGQVYPAAGINFVAPATGLDGEKLVIKINPPYDTTEFLSELAYLRVRNGHVCVRIMEDDRDRRAMLLERAVPGEAMDEVFDGRESECLGPAIKLLQELVTNPVEPSSDSIHLDTWFDNLRRAEGTAFPQEYVKKTLAIYDRLGRNNITLLHGDFHPRNIVSSTREPFLVIDPKGLVGAFGYEISVFLNNYHWWHEGRQDLADRLTQAARRFADEFGFSERDVREWAYAQAVVSAWWTFDELPAAYYDDVAKANVWDV